jgi:hypothetical protein
MAIKAKLKQQQLTVAGFDVFTAVTLNNAAFWDVALYGSCENRCFGGASSLHLANKFQQTFNTFLARIFLLA